jgi:hypothetical protein
MFIKLIAAVQPEILKIHSLLLVWGPNLQLFQNPLQPEYGGIH